MKSEINNKRQQVMLKDVLQDKGYIRGPFGSALKRGEMLKTGVPVYEQQHAIYGSRNFRFYISNDKFEEMKRFAVQPDDLIISCSGTVGKVSKIEQNDPVGIISQALLLLRVNKAIVNADYLKYFFLSEEGYNSIVSRSSGSVQVNISKRQVIEQIPLSLPSIPEQNAIVKILKSFDNKIELNNNINANLQQQAEAIFKSWFVDFEPFQNGEFVESELGLIPKGWKIGQLSDIAIITMGQSPSGSSYNEDGEGEIFFQGRAEFGNRFPTRRLYTTEPKRMAEIDAVLMSVRAPVGDINVAHKRCCIGRGLAAIQSKSGYSSFMLYQLFALKKNLDVFNGEGTVFGSINRNALNTLQIIIPSEDALKAFEKIAKPIDKLIRKNYDEICTLETIRNTLLPKLMNGEIEITKEAFNSNRS